MRFNRFIRKLGIVAKYSYSLIIPKQMVKALGWREKQRLEIIPDFKKNQIIIRDYEK